MIAAAIVLAIVACPHAVQACAACYGQSDSSMAKGMNWGIFSLLAVVASVLGAVASFFVYLGRKSSASRPADTATEPTHKD